MPEHTRASTITSQLLGTLASGSDKHAGLGHCFLPSAAPQTATSSSQKNLTSTQEVLLPCAGLGRTAEPGRGTPRADADTDFTAQAAADLTAGGRAAEDGPVLELQPPAGLPPVAHTAVLTQQEGLKRDHTGPGCPLQTLGVQESCTFASHH